MSTLMIVLIVVGVLVVWLFSVYNKLVQLKTQIEAAIQEIGNQLKRQAELIPNLVGSVKGYMKHEKDIFKDITEARKQVLEIVKVDGSNVQQLIDLSSKMQQLLAPIRAVFESTPELQAAAPTQKLMDELRDTSDKVMYARRTLIDLTADYNMMIVSIPSNFVAMVFGFKKEAGLKTPDTGEHIEVSNTETKAPKVEL